MCLKNETKFGISLWEITSGCEPYKWMEILFIKNIDNFAYNATCNGLKIYE